jgi:hypothetical protein
MDSLKVSLALFWRDAFFSCLSIFQIFRTVWADGTAAVYSEIDAKELRETGEHDLKFAGLKSVFSVSLPLFSALKGPCMHAGLKSVFSVSLPLFSALKGLSTVLPD